MTAHDLPKPADVSPASVGAPLPEQLDGHWSSARGHEMAVEYAGLTRSDLAMSHLSDFELANAQFLVDRYDFALIHYQTAAKERIRWLSAQLALAQGKSA